MGKLLIRCRGAKVGEVTLKLGDTTIGRSASCDIVLKDDKSVSSKHAIIKTVGMQSTIEDLGSTNGTLLEGRRIKRHLLRRGDSIIIGEHELAYRDDTALDTPAPNARPAAPPAPEDSLEKTRLITAYAQLLGVEGPDKGKRVPLMKEETVIDNPGKNPARIYRSPDGYVLSAQAGPGEPRLNDKPVPPGGQLLAKGDIVEIAGTKYQFLK